MRHTEYESQYSITAQLAAPVDMLNWSNLRNVKKNLENVWSLPRIKKIELINKIERINPYWKYPRPQVFGEYGDKSSFFITGFTFSGLVLTAE
jgi:hypothetical protein